MYTTLKEFLRDNKLKDIVQEPKFTVKKLRHKRYDIYNKEHDVTIHINLYKDNDKSFMHIANHIRTLDSLNPQEYKHRLDMLTNAIYSKNYVPTASVATIIYHSKEYEIYDSENDVTIHLVEKPTEVDVFFTYWKKGNRYTDKYTVCSTIPRKMMKKYLSIIRLNKKKRKRDTSHEEEQTQATIPCYQ